MTERTLDKPPGFVLCVEASMLWAHPWARTALGPEQDALDLKRGGIFWDDGSASMPQLRDNAQFVTLELLAVNAGTLMRWEEKSSHSSRNCKAFQFAATARRGGPTVGGRSQAPRATFASRLMSVLDSTGLTRW